MRVGLRAFQRRMRCDERGAIAVIVALMLVVLLGMAALVVDVGGFLSFRRQMVAAADSAALAAARACASGKTLAQAEVDADIYAAENAPGMTSANRPGATLVIGTCGSTGSGSVTLTYQRVRDNVFAPVLGQESTTVGATAEASWGSLSSGIPPPVLVSLAPFENCFSAAVRSTTPVSVDTEKMCVLFFDQDQVGNGQWGFLNLDTWNQDCSSSNNGNPNISKYIPEHGTTFEIDPDPSWVCVVPGARAAQWTQELNDQRYVAGVKKGIRMFPVITGTRDSGAFTQAAVSGFAPMRIRMAQFPSGGSGGTASTCSSSAQRDKDEQFTLDSLNGSGCPGTIASVTVGPVLTYKTGTGQNAITSPAVVCETPLAPPLCHYSYDSDTRTITWLENDATVTVDFTWISLRVPGQCELFAGAGAVIDEPSSTGAVACVVVSWPGPQVSSGGIGSTPDFGARAVDLTG